MIRTLIMYRSIEQGEEARGYASFDEYKNTGIFLNRPFFEVDRAITRAEFVKILIRSLPCQYMYMGKDTKYKDIDENMWYAPYIKFAQSHGWLDDFGQEEFRPNDPITGREIIQMLIEALKLDNPVFVRQMFRDYLRP